MLTTPPEPIGKRIARLRSENGWTQQTLSARLALSRVAISHIEMDLILPSERTITLLAGLFKVPPHELVAGTTYPQAKVEKLPAVVCCYTELELDLALMENDLAWLARLRNATQSPPDTATDTIQEVGQKWATRLSMWVDQYLDEREKVQITEALKKLKREQANLVQPRSDTPGTPNEELT